jgi:molybdate transport repressor ModE-like protein
MYRVNIKPILVIERDEHTRQSLPGVLELCAAIHDGGNLVEAARRIGLSYRHAWGLLKAAGEVLGAPVVQMSRGRSARLTNLGEKLIWADKRIAARLAPTLQSLSSELQTELERALLSVTDSLRVSASHGFAVATLHEVLAERDIPVELRYMASADAVRALAADQCDLAGFHAPLGDLEPAVVARYAEALRGVPLRIIHLATRRQGIIVPKGNPKAILTLADLTRPDVRFVNRQPESGTRYLLELLLKQAGLKASRITGWTTAEYTHAAVAAYVGSGMADAGFGIETGARRFGLDFVPVATERYFFACRADRLAWAPIVTVLDILRSQAFRDRVDLLPGYDGAGSGEVMTLSEAFQVLKR